jgi:hypothetical protein
MATPAVDLEQRTNAVRENCTYFSFTLGTEVLGSFSRTMRELKGQFSQRKSVSAHPASSSAPNALA